MSEREPNDRRRAARRSPARPGAPEGKRERNRQRRVEELRQAALPLFLADGVNDVTVDRIAEHAGLAKGSFYHYFVDKEDLVRGLMAPLADSLRGTIATAREAVRRLGPTDDPVVPFAALAQSAGWILLTHQDLLRLYLQESRAPATGARRPIRELGDDIADLSIELGMASRERGMFRDLDPRVTPLAIIGAAERLLFEHFCRRDLGDPAAIARELTSLIIDGLRLTGFPQRIV